MVIIFGIGNIATKTINKYSISPSFCVDNSNAVWGSKWSGLNVLEPKSLLNSSIKRIIICTTSYKSVIKQLQDLGVDQKIIEVSSVLNSIQISDRIESIEFDILFASGLPSHSSSLSGGGLYRLSGDLKNNNLEKIYSGNCHNISRYINGYVITDSNKGLVFLDESLSETSLIQLPSGLRPHGCAVVSDDRFALACAYDDSIIIFDSEGIQTSKYRISNLIDQLGTPQHHVNDVCYFENFLYASMFSLSGAWQSGFLDGGVLRFDVNTGESSIVLDSLAMPHNIKVGGEGYLVCDSYNSRLLSNNKLVEFQANGFLRGLNDMDDYWIVAESKNRNFANIKGGPLNPCLDSRINFVDKESHAYVSIQLPSEVTEIHSICSI
jgi:hypothetical protein